MIQGPLDVAQIASGARLVVVGGTGFLGKIFWSMLLDRYPGIGRIYLVVRPKGAATPEARFWGEIATSVALAPLRRAHGAAFEAFIQSRVVPVHGDMGKPLCGLSESLVAELRGTIDAVVNVAGIVDFNPPLDEALDANAFGAQNLVHLARSLGNVPVLHTSTCYVAGTRRGPIREEDPRASPFPRAEELGAELWQPEREIAECLDLVHQARQRSDDAFRQSEFADRANKNLLARGEPVHGKAYADELARVKRKFVRERLVEAGLDRATHWGWPNIYLYTKAIGEQVIAASGLPFTIVRPACCESCIEYPEPAYNEGINTSAPLIYLMMKGEAQVLAKEVPLDLIPSDYVVAGMILALAELLEGTAASVYQLGASDVNPCTAARFGELVGLYKRRFYRRAPDGNPLLNAIQARFEPTFVERARFEATGAPGRANVAREVASVLRKAVPALGSAARALEGLAKQNERAADVQRLFEPFTAKENGPFDCSNTRAAYARLSEEDKRKLTWAPESIDWADWMMNIHMPAMEKHILPEMDRKVKKVPKALAPHETLASLLDEMADRHGHAPALQLATDQGLTRTSYAEVLRGADAVSGILASLGVARGDRVALSGQNHPNWAVAFFGIVRAGATAVPVDPGLDDLAAASVVAESGASVLLVDADVKWRSAVARRSDVVILDLHETALDEGAFPPPDVVISPGDIASVLFTSGTSGRPKGVMLTHANFTSLVAALAPLFPLSPGDAVVSVLPLHHTFEFTCGLLLPLSRGARVVYVSELRGDRIAEAMRASRATAMVGVPALWQMLERRILARADAGGPLVRAAFDAALEVNRWLLENARIDLGAVLFGAVHKELGGNIRWFISGGAALPRETQETFAGLGLALTQGYGLTEAAPVLSVGRPGKRVEPGVGSAVPGVELRIENPDPRGVGEIVARGPNVMAGYTGDAAAGQVKDREGWLHTGDLGRLDGKGRLQIVGRLKDVVITASGENVYPEDVERRLASVPCIAELAIVGITVRGSERLACLAVRSRDDRDDRDGRVARNDRARAELRRSLEELPPHQRPSIVHLLDAPLPRTATRKVRRDEVRAILERLAAAGVHRENGAAPASLARAVVSALRGLPQGQVHPDATLAGDLGFDSLLMAELLEAFEQRGRSLEPTELELCVTVADVDRLLARNESAPERPSPTSERGPSSFVLPEPMKQAGKAMLGRALDLFYRDVMQPRVSGRNHIPHNRAVIVVANHASHLDMGFVRHALGKYGEGIVSLAAQDYFFESGVKRAFFENLTNLKPLDRRASLRQSIRQASEIIERGKTVLLFPEGTRSPSGEIQEFKPLVGYLALAHGVTILPIFLGGTFDAMSKGTPVPRRREITARIGPPLGISDLRRLTQGLAPAPAAREVAKIAHSAVLALRDGGVLDIAHVGHSRALTLESRPHPLVTLFAELEGKFRAGEVERPLSYYVTLGQDEMAKWTVRIDKSACNVRPGKPEGGQADCVLKTTPELFARIVRESYVPSASDFLSGAFKSNDVSLLVTFQRVFRLDQAS